MIEKTKENVCSICLNSNNSIINFVTTNCGHDYHTYCLEQWVLTQIKVCHRNITNICVSCPNCRQNITQDCLVFINKQLVLNIINTMMNNSDELFYFYVDVMNKIYRMDEEISRLALKKCIRVYTYIPNKLKENSVEIIKDALKYFIITFEDVPTSMKTNRDVIDIAIMCGCIDVYKNLSEELKENEEIICDIIQFEPSFCRQNIYEKLSDKMKHNKNVIITVLKSGYNIYNTLPEHLKNDKDIKESFIINY